MRRLSLIGFSLVTTFMAACPAATWAQNCGFAIVAEPGDQGRPSAISDGAGGAYVAWWDNRSGEGRIYVLRLDSNGAAVPGWPASGLLVNTEAVPLQSPSLAVDGAGGAYLAWASGSDVYLQRVDASGTIAAGWPASGAEIAMYAANYSVIGVRVVGVDGGAVVAWRIHYTNSYQVCESPGYCYTVTESSTEIRLAGTGPAGATSWNRTGIGFGGSSYQPVHVELVTDGAGGAIAVQWADFDGRITATRFLSSGAVAADWPGELKGSYYVPSELRLHSNGAGGAIAVWREPLGYTDVGVLGAQIDAGGHVLPGWGPSKVVASTLDGTLAPDVVPDGAGGAIVSWLNRDTSEARTLVLRLDASGAVPAGWPAQGVGLCSLPGAQSGPVLAEDGYRGAFAAWALATPAGLELRAHHVLADGLLSPTYEPDGSVVCSGTIVGDPLIVKLGDLRALVVWQDGGSSGGCCPDVRGAVLTEDLQVPVRVTSARAEVSADRVSLSWWVSQPEGSSFLIERSPRTEGPWSTVASAIVAAQGVITWDDSSLEPGAEAVYRLRLPNTDAPVSGSLVSARRPAVALAIGGPFPNPVAGEMIVAARVPGEGAVLELFGLDGRRLRMQRVSRSGRVSLGDTRAMPPGVYLLRLSHGGLATIARVSVVR